MKVPIAYYEYSQLPAGSIRLLRLHGTGPHKTLDAFNLKTYERTLFEQELVIDLETFDLKQCPRYIALSYTWGYPGGLADPAHSIMTPVERIYPIYCERKILRGTWNLRAALRRIRYAVDEQESAHLDRNLASSADKCLGGATYFWIDALCINQDNLHERAMQVKNMGEIYKQAQSTILWLGDSDMYTNEACKVLLKMNNRMKDAYGIACKSDVDEYVVDPISLDPSEIRAFVALLNRNWFLRYWVVQEVMLSKRIDVWIGPQMFGFQFLRYVRLLRQLDTCLTTSLTSRTQIEGPPIRVDQAGPAWLNVKFLTSLDRIMDHFSDREELADFVSVMHMCRYHECSDPRDRIYSVLALCRELHSDSAITLIPDYTEKFELVYRRATEMVLQRHKDLRILNLTLTDKRPGSKFERSSDLPSWCPDYRSVAPPTDHTVTLPRAWKFEKGRHPIVKVHGSVLRAFGQRIGHLVEKAGHSYDPQSPETWNGPAGVCALLTRVQTGPRLGIRSDLQNMSRVEVLWRTLLPYLRSVLTHLTGVKGTNLPSSFALLLPMVLRQLLLAHTIFSRYASDQDISWPNRTKAGFEIEDYGAFFESALWQLRRLEPENAHFLPKSGQIAQICAEAKLSLGSAQAVAANLNQQDLDMLPTRAKALGLYLPDSYFTTPRTDLIYGNRHTQHAGVNWMVGLIDAMGQLGNPHIFRTDSHLLGMAHCSPEPDDQLWILDGGYFPYFLRPLPNGSYRYVGQTFVHGLNDGEAIPLCQDPTTISIE